MQQGYLEAARANLKANTRTDIKDYQEFVRYFTPQNEERPEIHGGFAWSGWCGSSECADKLPPLKLTIRCVPLEPRGGYSHCVLCGAPAKSEAVFAKAY